MPERPSIARARSVLPSTSSSCDSSAGKSLSSSEFRANWPHEPERLVARDARDPGRRPLGRLAAVPAAPGPNRGFLCRVLGGAGCPENAPCLAQALRADEVPIPIGQRSPRQRCNELNGQEGLPTMTLTLESDATRAYAVLAPAYDLLTAEYAYGPWLVGHRACRARARAVAATACSTSAAAPARASCPCSSAASTSPRATSRPRWSRSPEQKAGASVDVHVADMRRLPVVRRVRPHHVHRRCDQPSSDPGEVADALAGMRENLAPGGHARLRRQHARRLPSGP